MSCVTPPSQVCRKCAVEKPVSEYYKNHRTCKKCNYNYVKKPSIWDDPEIIQKVTLLLQKRLTIRAIAAEIDIPFHRLYTRIYRHPENFGLTKDRNFVE